MLKYYLLLQSKRIHRMIMDRGGYVFLNYFCVAGLFTLVSSMVFYKIDFLNSLYILIALHLTAFWSSQQHNDFLKLTYSRKDKFIIRLAENEITVLPFVLLIFLSGQFLLGLSLIIQAVLLVFLTIRFSWQIKIPTPFGKHPFEFVVGFRLAFIFFFFAYGLTYIALTISNPGIGLFAILAVSVICTFFYVMVEDIFYVWIFSLSAKKFLAAKLKTAVLATIFLSTPILLAMIIAYPSQIHAILLFQLVGLGYVSAGVLCKYSTFPGEIQVKEGLLLFPFTIMFPPMLLFTIPHLYRKSLRSLEGILV